MMTFHERGTRICFPTKEEDDDGEEDAEGEDAGGGDDDVSALDTISMAASPPTRFAPCDVSLIYSTF